MQPIWLVKALNPHYAGLERRGVAEERLKNGEVETLSHIR